jgi:hypothetical protein
LNGVNWSVTEGVGCMFGLAVGGSGTGTGSSGSGSSGSVALWLRGSVAWQCGTVAVWLWLKVTVSKSGCG